MELMSPPQRNTQLSNMQALAASQLIHTDNTQKKKKRRFFFFKKKKTNK